MANFTVTPSYRIHYQEEGVSLEVREDPECYGVVEIRTTDKASEEYFGKILLGLGADLAKVMGETLIRITKELGK